MIGKKQFGITSDNADALCVDAVQYLAGDTDILERFIALTGLMPDQLRAIMEDDGVKIGVLDFLLSDESLLLAFAERTGRNPEQIGQARMQISGEPLAM